VCWPSSDGGCGCGRGHEKGGKAPLVDGGYKSATIDIDTLEEWDRRWPDANIGIALGPSGLFVIDLDGPEAIEEATALGLGSGTYAATGAGLHWYYERPLGSPVSRSTRRGTSGKIDVLADGGLIVPPSRHASGKTYVWGSGPSELGAPPAWALEMLQVQVQARVAVMASGPVEAIEIEPPPGLSADGLAVWQGEGYAEDRSLAISRLSMYLANAGIEDQSTLSGVLKGWDAARGSEVPNGPKYLKRADGDRRYGALAQSAIAKVAERKGRENKEAAKPTLYVTLCEEFQARWPNIMLVDEAWYEYKGGIWEEVKKYAIEYKVQEIMGAQMKPQVVLGVERMLRGRLSQPVGVWSDAPEVIVCQNVAVDVETGQSYGHAPEFLARQKTDYFYDPEAKAPTWDAFMAERFEPEVAMWLQEFAGLCLTKDMTQEVAVWLYSPPGAGKSTFIAGMQRALGPARAGRLSLADMVRNPRFSLVNIPGKTMLVAAEQPSTWVDCSDVINSLISGDTISIEAKHQNVYDARPVCKILWGMNELPRFQSAADGIFRRVRIVKMQAIAKLDPRIKDKIEAEGAGILNWAMEGLRRLRLSGQSLAARTPQNIELAGSEFKRSNDVVSSFFDERMERDGQVRMQAQELYDAYNAWCIRNGYRPKSRNTVGQEWARMGLEAKVSGGRTYYIGARLKDTSLPKEDE
jgi:P4 family phage/plasmid primase-like protien